MRYDADSLITSTLVQALQAANDYAVPMVVETPTLNEVQRYVGYMEGYANAIFDTYVKMGVLQLRDLQGVFDIFACMREDFAMVKKAFEGTLFTEAPDGSA